MALAARCCYAEGNPLDDRLFNQDNNETNYWEWLESACINRGHYSPLEYCQLTFLCLNVPVSIVSQLRTHRGLSMQVQSLRYTSERICNPAKTNEELFHSRRVESHDRKGFSPMIPQELEDKAFNDARALYKTLVEEMDVSPEVARNILPSCYTQNFVLSCNLRELFHVFSLRTPKDAQLEMRDLMYLLYEQTMLAVPDAMRWFYDKHWGKFKASF